MKKIFFLTFLFYFTLMVISACGIETIQPVIELNPPLGLTAETTTNGIELWWWSVNPESYFYGFDVYISENKEDLRNNKGHKIPNSDGDVNNPTLWRGVTHSSNAIRYHLVLKQNYNYQPFNNISYYFWVKAYTKEYNLHSKPSNITNTTYTNL